MLTIDIDKGTSGNVSLTGAAKDAAFQTTAKYLDIGGTTQVTGITTTIDIAGNSNLRLHCRSSEEHQHAYYGNLISHYSLITFHCSLFTVH